MRGPCRCVWRNAFCKEWRVLPSCSGIWKRYHSSWSQRLYLALSLKAGGRVEVNTLLGAASNQDEQCTLILAWKPKQSKQVMICENGSGGQLVIEAFISQTEGIATQKQLRQQTYIHSSRQTDIQTDMQTCLPM